MIYHFQAILQIHKRNDFIIDCLSNSDNPLYKFYPYLIVLYIKIFIIPFKFLNNIKIKMLGALASIGKSLLPGAMSMGK